MSLGNKIDFLIDVPLCKDKNYKRENTPKEIREQIIHKNNGECFLCRTLPKQILVHHVNPKGESTEDNLVVLCNACHVWVHRILNKLKGYKAVRTYVGFW